MSSEVEEWDFLATKFLEFYERDTALFARSETHWDRAEDAEVEVWSIPMDLLNMVHAAGVLVGKMDKQFIVDSIDNSPDWLLRMLQNCTDAIDRWMTLLQVFEPESVYLVPETGLPVIRNPALISRNLALFCKQLISDPNRQTNRNQSPSPEQQNGIDAMSANDTGILGISIDEERHELSRIVNGTEQTIPITGDCEWSMFLICHDNYGKPISDVMFRELYTGTATAGAIRGRRSALNGKLMTIDLEINSNWQILLFGT